MATSTFCACSGKKKCARLDYCSCKKANLKCGLNCKCVKGICQNHGIDINIEIDTGNLVERIQQHPFAAAMALRTNGLVAVFDALTAVSVTTSLAVVERAPATPVALADLITQPSAPTTTPREFETEDVSQAYIVGMPHHPLLKDSANRPTWCHCGRCREVRNKKARVCCQRTTAPCVLLEDSELRYLVLSSRSVRTAMNQARCLRHQNTWDYNAANLRFQAYQQYIYATIGGTGRGNRVPIPACICWAIRDRWPSLSYVGFREEAVNGKLELDEISETDD